MSAIPPKGDIANRHYDVRLVPKADSCASAILFIIRPPRRRWCLRSRSRTLCAGSRRQRHSRDFCADHDEAVLQSHVVGLQVRLHALPVLTRDIGLRIVARSEPGLGQMRIARSRSSSRTRWSPDGCRPRWAVPARQDDMDQAREDQAVLDSFPRKFDPSVGIRISVYIAFP